MSDQKYQQNWQEEQEYYDEDQDMEQDEGELDELSQSKSKTVVSLICRHLVIQTILELGNQVLANLGVEEPINDVAVFFSDQFYIRFFEQAFPDIDFSSLEEAQTDEDMANNI